MRVSNGFRRLVTAALIAIALTGAAAIAVPTPAQAATFPPVGSVVCHVAPVSGVRCGVVTNVNLAILHADGTIVRVFAYNACALPGDGGAPIFRQSNGTQVGTIFGTLGPCRTAGLPLP